ncbi:MAG: radical SAM protein, partial [Planctomycetota bacterium]
DCGTQEGLVSADAAAWQWKRDLCRHQPEAPTGCALNCDACAHPVPPRLLFVDVTNRCNMNCPICLANVPGMGFEFNPPLDYFETLFAQVATWDPVPRIQLFGGEPTVRKDLFDIIALAKDHGIQITVNTNGLKLADPDYCRRLCETGVRLLIGFDGSDPEIYQKLRKTRAPAAKKVQGLENLKKFSTRKNTIICAVAKGVNDEKIADLLARVHDLGECVKRVHFVPLAALWDEGDFDDEDLVTTHEEVEQIIDQAFPDEPVDFLPVAVSTYLAPAYRFFSPKTILRFEGVHPNCESVAYMVSDGQRFHPMSYVLRRPVRELADELVGRATKVNAKLARLDRSQWLDRLRGKLAILRGYGGLVLRNVRFRRFFRGNPLLGTLGILGGLLIGRKLKTQIRKHTYAHDSLMCLVLPFEEIHSLEAARLHRCSVGFGYVDPETEQVRTIPFCSWILYRKDAFRRITDKYGVCGKPSRQPAAAAAEA